MTQEQPGDVFDLPNLEIELVTPTQRVRRSLQSARRVDTLDLSDLADVTDARVDPDHHFLMQRHWGESSVRFELPVSRIPETQSVMLAGNFLRAPIAATRAGDSWVVELPMTEGQYTWLWQVGGTSGRGGASASPDPMLTGTRVVQPLERMTNAYPGR